MAPATRTSGRKGKRANYNAEDYFSQLDILSDDGEVSDAGSVGSVEAPKPKRRRLTKAGRSPSLSSPSKSVSSPALPARPAKDIADVADIWHEVFELMILKGERATVAKCISLNKNIGSAAARLTYRGSTEGLKAKQLVGRARSIFRSMSYEAAFRYCETVNELDINDFVCAFVEDGMTVEEFYRRILGFPAPQQATLRDLTRGDLSAMSDSVALWLCGQTQHLPVLKQLGAKKLGFGIIAPAVFSNLVSLRLSASVVNKNVGEIVVKGCTKLQILGINYPFSSPRLAYRSRSHNTLPPLEENDTGNAVREFIEAFPVGFLKGFEMCLHDTTVMDQDCGEEDAVGLGYTESRLLLQALKHQTKLESLKLARMDPQAYADLPELDELHDTLTSLHIVMPDRLWGSHPGLKSQPPPFLMRTLTRWLKNCHKLRKLYWSSRDDKQSPRFGHSNTWTDLIATALPQEKGSSLLQNLEEATFVLGLDRVYVYKRIRYLKNLKHLRIVTDTCFSPAAPRQRTRVRLDSEELAQSLVENPTLESADIKDLNFLIGKRAFSFPKYSPKRINYTDKLNSKLRSLTIRSNDAPQEVGMWKFVSRLTGLRFLRLHTYNNWKPDDLVKFIKSSNLAKKADAGGTRRFELGNIDRGSWEDLSDNNRRLFQQYLDLRLYFAGSDVSTIIW